MRTDQQMLSALAARLPCRILISSILFAVTNSVAFAQSAPLLSFRSSENVDSQPMTLAEISRQGRMSTFQTSVSAVSRSDAVFILCSFAEFAKARGFSHISVMEPKKEGDTYLVGLFNSEEDDLAEAFGDHLDRERLLGKKPGAVATILPMCSGKQVPVK